MKKINIKTEHFKKDLDQVLYDNDTLKVYKGYKPEVIDAALMGYIVNVMTAAYEAGLKRAVMEYNKIQ